jgi:hypothetical protein
MVFAKKENKQPMANPKIFPINTTDNFLKFYKSVQTYFRYERKNFTVNANKIDWGGGRLKGKALFRHQSR